MLEYVHPEKEDTDITKLEKSAVMALSRPSALV